jgi:hypothetical protein
MRRGGTECEMSDTPGVKTFQTGDTSSSGGIPDVYDWSLPHFPSRDVRAIGVNSKTEYIIRVFVVEALFPSFLLLPPTSGPNDTHSSCMINNIVVLVVENIILGIKAAVAIDPFYKKGNVRYIEEEEGGGKCAD